MVTKYHFLSDLPAVTGCSIYLFYYVVNVLLQNDLQRKQTEHLFVTFGLWSKLDAWQLRFVFEHQLEFLGTIIFLIAVHRTVTLKGSVGLLFLDRVTCFDVLCEIR